MTKEAAQKFADMEFGAGKTTVMEFEDSRYGWLLLVAELYADGTTAYTALMEDPDGYCEPYDFTSTDEAEVRRQYAYFKRMRDDASAQPDWEAQAEYDALHGTINGEDPGVVMMNELWGE